jgi:hypothetical protein
MTTGQHKPPLIQLRDKSCFCEDCVNNNTMSQCVNIASGYVSQWDQKELVRMPPYEDDDNDIDIHDPIYSADYERVSDLVVTGDIFAVIADPENAEGVDYYLLRCTKEKSKLVQEIVDGDGQQYPTGSVVIEGTYYQQAKIDKNGIQFIEYMPGQRVLHYSHLVIATKLQFETVPKRGRGNQKWKLTIEEHERLLEIIKDREDPEYMYQEL